MSSRFRKIMMDLAQEYHEKLLDAVSMFDDDIMEKYMEGEEIPRADDRRQSARPPAL